MKRRNFDDYHIDLKPNTMNAMKPLSSAEAFLCCREDGRKIKRARSARYRAFYFSVIVIFIGIPSGSLCGGERFNINGSYTYPKQILVLPSLG